VIFARHSAIFETRFEVVVAVGAYWAFAIYFETTTHLWVSICVAPLLLLRSGQSIAPGAKWFDSYAPKTKNPTHPTREHSSNFCR